MKKRWLVVATAIGAAIGIFAKIKFDEYKRLSPENVLERVKNSFKRSTPISGSWIYMKPLTIEHNGLTYDVYRGGVTQTYDDEQKQVEFFADQHTGTVIKTKEQT